MDQMLEEGFRPLLISRTTILYYITDRGDFCCVLCLEYFSSAADGGIVLVFGPNKGIVQL